VFAARTEGPTPEAPTVQPTRSPLWDHVSERTLALVVVGACVLLYLPFCGSYGFWDPWEGHYA